METHQDFLIIGHSVLGKPIHAYHIGGDGDQFIVIGGIHAREWITTLLLMEILDIYKDTKFDNNAGIWLVPLVNPDGVEIALTIDPLWKSNARGVDLNVNFDADWGQGIQNVRTPGPENYIGPYPVSEPETRALVDFTLRIKPRATIAYHSKGEVIYYGDQDFAHRIANITGYTPIESTGSSGGYTDWVMTLGTPAVTIEVGNDDLPHPIGGEHLAEILRQNISIFRDGFKDLL